MLDKSHHIFTAQIKHLASLYVSDKELLQKTLKEKSETRCFDEAKKPLASYRQFELTQMHANFYGNEAYHQARKDFVYKVSDHKTPENIALHRQKEGLKSHPSSGSMTHFVWQQQYEMGDDAMDSQHKDLFVLADKLLASASKEELTENIKPLYQHVEEHFMEEEALMKKLNYRDYKEHKKAHQLMLKSLNHMGDSINDDHWEQSNIHHFVTQWGEHIIHSDMSFNRYIQQQGL